MKKRKSGKINSQQSIPHLCNHGILDLAVDGAELLGEELLSLLNKTIEAVLVGGNLVATLRNDVAVVVGTPAVPGEEL